MIGADGVTLDLNGHVIDGVVKGFHTGVDNRGGFDNVTIKNGTVREFGFAGIFVEEASGTTLTGLTVDHNPRFGILDIFSSGSRVENNVAFENRPPENNFGTGISVNFGSGDTVRRNVTWNNNEGIGMSSERNGRVEGNSLRNDYLSGSFLNSVVADNSLVGGYISAGLIDSRMEHNSVHDSNFHGIRLGHGSNSVVSENVVSGADMSGIFLEDSETLDIVGNSTSGNGTTGISLESGSVRNVIERNKVFDNGTAGIGIGLQDFVRTPADNWVADNRVLRNGTAGIQILRGRDTDVALNLIRRNGGDGILVGGRTVLDGNTSVRNGDDGIQVNGVQSTVENNRADNNADLGIVALPGVTDGGGNRARHNGNPLQCLNVFCK